MPRRARAASAVLGLSALLVTGLPAAGAAAPAAAPPVPIVAPSTPVFSPRRAPDLLSRFAADTHLATDLDRVMTDPVLGGARDRSCLVVGEPDGSATHYARQPDVALVPASTMKLLTTTAALSQLGPSSHLTTEIRAGAPPAADGGVGDLFMVGGGDPLLSTADFAVDAGYMGQPRLATSMESLADKVVASGVRRVGRLLGDESRYDAQRLVPSWSPSYIAEFEISPLSALVVNKDYATAKPPTLGPSPPALAASVLAGLLRARGVTVGSTGEGRAPGGSPLVTSIDSPPLADVVGEILQHSDNMGAEMLVKELAAHPGTPGTTVAGLGAVASQLQKLAGVTTDQVATVDGSGLDRSDRLSCGVLERVLAQAGDAGPLASALPTAGRNGTLLRRFGGTAAAGKVRAKTGSLNGVAALAGFTTTTSGRSLAFALLANELPTAATGGNLQDRVVTVLAGYPRGPASADLGPKPPAR